LGNLPVSLVSSAAPIDRRTGYVRIKFYIDSAPSQGIKLRGGGNYQAKQLAAAQLVII
jgi:hypothetical protein